MKNILRHRILIIIAAIGVFSMLQACNRDHYKPMQHKWRMITDEATLVLNQDSSFIFSQRNSIYSGTWKLDDHGKTIVFKQKGKTEKRMAVKKISDESLILSDNGDEQDYVKAD
jgi:hypothetical protein